MAGTRGLAPGIVGFAGGLGGGAPANAPGVGELREAAATRRCVHECKSGGALQIDRGV
jgi:hypothetical protein